MRERRFVFVFGDLGVVNFVLRGGMMSGVRNSTGGVGFVSFSS